MKIAEPTVERLVQYHRLLERLFTEGQKVVSSQEMGESLAFKASQVRKDLSYFGEIGKRGVGYHVEKLYRHIDEILSPPRKWRLGLIGVGHLGSALLGYGALRSDKVEMAALFDNDESKVGQTLFGVKCYHIDEAARILCDMGIEVVLLAVPPNVAQSCVDAIVKSGCVKGILNFSPTSIVVPENVIVASVDISVELEKLLFFLKEKEKKK